MTRKRKKMKNSTILSFSHFDHSPKAFTKQARSSSTLQMTQVLFKANLFLLGKDWPIT